MICGNCDKTDGMVYVSMPPKMRCGISKRFHERGDECEFEWKPIIQGRWLFYEEPDGYYHTECSECGQWCDEDVFLKGKWHYCPNCGAKMDEVEE